MKGRDLLLATHSTCRLRFTGLEEVFGVPSGLCYGFGTPLVDVVTSDVAQLRSNSFCTNVDEAFHPLVPVLHVP